LIILENVRPSGRELRQIWRGWGAVHWACIPHTNAFIVGFGLYGVASIEWADGLIPTGAFLMMFGLSYVVWVASGWAVRRAAAAEGSRAPTGGKPWRWTIDHAGFTFDNGLQTNRLAWGAIKSVKEDADRYVLLVTPQNNPVLPKRILDDRQHAEFRRLVDVHFGATRRG